MSSSWCGGIFNEKAGAIMVRSLILLLCNIVFCAHVASFPLDGESVLISKSDIKGLNKNTCSGNGGVDKYEAWKFPSPASYISARVYCNTITASDGYQRRNVFDCDNKKGEWSCDVIATELKYILSPPINFIFLRSSYLSEKESIEVIDKLVSSASDPDMYREASCSIDNKTRNNKNLYVVECNYKKYVEMLKTCEGSSCTWTTVKAGNILN